LDGISFFVDNEAEAPVLIKESQPMAPYVLVDSTLAENRYLSFAHLTLNKRRLDIEPSSDDSCIDAEGACSNSTTAMAYDCVPILRVNHLYGFSARKLNAPAPRRPAK
jgi:hypothetical protein